MNKNLLDYLNQLRGSRENPLIESFRKDGKVKTKVHNFGRLKDGAVEVIQDFHETQMNRNKELKEVYTIVDNSMYLKY